MSDSVAPLAEDLQTPPPVAQHTPGPWTLGEYDDYMGYDCMTGGVRAGPVVLDANTYGQSWRQKEGRDANFDKPRMMADARLIAAAPELLAALAQCETALMTGLACSPAINAARAAMLQAREGK